MLREQTAATCRARESMAHPRQCGAVASYMIWGDPCNCTVEVGLAECAGHPVCVPHAAALRRGGTPLHAEQDMGAFVTTRIESLVPASRSEGV